MMKKLIALTLMAATVAACGNKPVPDPAIAACPAKTLKVLQKNQEVLKDVVPGESPVGAVKDLRGMVRQATLEKGGDSMGVAFYQTGLPKCPWLVADEMLTPVVVKNGTIVAKGGRMLTDLTHSGWVITEAAWPWQRYEFGYLPNK